MLQIALPNKGALAGGAIELIQAAGYRCARSSRELLVRDSENEATFYFLRPRDIATYVDNGVLDLGITGRDMLIDSQASVEEILPLGFGQARLCYAVPRGSKLQPKDFGGLRIATTYTRLLSWDLERRGIKATLIRLDGAVEIAIRLGVADAIADLVQTGQTLEKANLMVVGQPILNTEAVLVARSRTIADTQPARMFLQRVRGILLAREYVMVEYVCSRSLLDDACTITPGIESPTLAPLNNPDLVSVKAMAKRKDTNQIMDALQEIGAKGILITDIRTCRI